MQAEQPPAVGVSAAAFGAKFRSKRECYNFLTVECKFYLPPYDTLTIYFLKDLVTGAKKGRVAMFNRHVCLALKCDSFKYIYCPQYEGISVKAMMENAVGCPELMAYLPDGKEIPQLPRQWLANVIYTVFGRQFAQWVEEKILERN